MKPGSTDALVSVLEAASAYINHVAAEELPPKRVLRMAHSAALQARVTLDRVGLSPNLSGGGRRDDTDELLGRALGTGLPIDDGPEGVADPTAPLATDETSSELISFADEPPEPMPVEVEYDPDSVGGAIIDDEVTLKSGTGAPTPIESFDLVSEDEPEEDHDDDTGDGPTALEPDFVEEVSSDVDSASYDSPSVSEVIVSKQDAAREVETLRSEASPAFVTIPAAPSVRADHDDEVETEDHGTLDADEENTLATNQRALSEAVTASTEAITASSEADEEPDVELGDTDDSQSPRAQSVPVAGIAMGGREVSGRFSQPTAVPTIRDQSTPKPRAAAIQLGTDEGSPVVLGMEEEDEPIAVGGAEDDDDYDYDPDDYDPDAGFTLEVEEYEEYEYEEEEEPEPEPEPEPVVPDLPQVDIAGSLKQASAAAEEGQLSDAIDLYSDVLDADYDNVQALVGRGRAQLVLGDFARAMSDFTIAHETAPQDPEPLIAIGDLYFERKDYKSAIEHYDAGLQADPSHALGFCRRGISHYSRKDYTAAVDDLNKAKELDPDLANIKTYISMAKKKARR